VATADRHLRLGRITAITLGGQFLGLTVTILLAWALESVWALVWGNVLGTVMKLMLLRRFMENSRNRLHWDGGIARELFHFGKWILVGTFLTFLNNNADKLILGAYISMADLGIYNLGLMMAGIAMGIVGAVKGKVLMPLYRMRPTWESAANRRKAFFVRRLISSGGIAATVLLSVFAIPVVEFLYDERYAMAGPIVMLLGLSLIPQLIVIGANNLMLVAGDSWRSMHLTAARAVVQTVLLVLGAKWFGIGGVILAPGLAVLLTHPLRAHYLRRYKGHDGLGEGLLFVVGMTPVALVCWMNRDVLLPLFVPSM
jgi:O-antigen/teichoic acid export membrane protein